MLWCKYSDVKTRQARDEYQQRLVCVSPITKIFRPRTRWKSMTWKEICSTIHMFPLKLKFSTDSHAIGPFRGSFFRHHLQWSLDSEWHMTLASRMVSVFCIVPYHWLLRIVQIVRNHINCYLGGSLQLLQCLNVTLSQSFKLSQITTVIHNCQIVTNHNCYLGGCPPVSFLLGFSNSLVGCFPRIDQKQTNS